MNKNQKIILAIFVPVIIFFIAFTIAYYTAVTIVPGWTNLERMARTGVPKYSHNPFDWEKTWYIWFLSLIGIILFEYKLFADKKRKIKN